MNSTGIKFRTRHAIALAIGLLATVGLVFGAIASNPASALAGDTVEVQSQTSAVTGLEDVSAAWKNFRNSDVNMAITEAATPTSSDTGKLLWTSKFQGADMNSQPTVPIIVDDCLVTTFKNGIYKLDLATGQVVASGTMVRATNWGYTPPTYAEGMVFVPIAGGVQAFDATTLESLWVYYVDSSAQSLSPIAYSDGCIYTGWWISETKDASFACIDVRDADTGNSTEAKTPMWTKTVAGGFYWAGAVVVGDHVIVGTDDGTSDDSGTAHVYSFDKKTGNVVSDIGVKDKGDVRSSMAYDADNGRIYFTSKDAYVCRLDIDANTGVLSNFASTHLVDSNGVVLSSTSTPVVYKGRIFVGAGNPVLGGGGGKSDAFFILDADSLKTLDKLELDGECKCSPLLSTAHESEGYLYFYVTSNCQPGGIEVVKVPADRNSRELAEVETLYDASGYEQYCISSPICADDGTIYFRNDSATLFAVGDAAKAPTIDSDLEPTCDAYLGEPCTLSVTASAQDVSSLSYQWYSSTDNSTYSVIDGATSSTYTCMPSEMGTQWLYCEVTATKGADSMATTAKVQSSKCEVNVDGYVDVTFENATYAAGAWNDTKTERVILSDVSAENRNAQALVQQAASEAGLTGLEFDAGNVSKLMGVGAGDAGASSEWVAFIDDWATTSGLSTYTIGDGTLASGSSIAVRYSANGGSDVGLGNGTDKSLASLDIDGLELAPTFSSSQTSYDAVLAPGTTYAKVRAVPTDKAFQVKVAAEDASGADTATTYPNGSTISVYDGQTITVTCGDPSWPTTAAGSAGVAAKTYTIEVKAAMASIAVSQPEFSRVSTGKIHAGEVQIRQVTIENTGNVTLKGLKLAKSLSEAFAVSDLEVSQLAPGEKTTVSVSTVEGTPASKNLNNDMAIPYTGSFTVSAKGSLGGSDDLGLEAAQTCSFSVEVDGIDWVRLSGEGRYETGAAIVEEGFDSTGGTAILVTGGNFPDALCASGLAGALDSDGSGVPVVLTSSDSLSDPAKEQLERLKPSKVVIVGGTAAVSNEVKSQVSNLLGCQIDRVYGDSRYETSNAVYEYGKKYGSWSNTAIVATGAKYADALSVSPYAYASKTAILLADSSGVLPDEASRIVKDGSFANVLIVGGTSAVSDKVETAAQIGQGKKVQRLSGANRDDTSIQIAKWATGTMDSAAFEPSEKLSFDNMAIATAWNYPDALAGASMCGKNKAVVVLMVDSSDGAQKLATELLTSKKARINTAYILGGTSAIGNDALNTLKSYM